jgi:hypothetical protein
LKQLVIDRLSGLYRFTNHNSVKSQAVANQQTAQEPISLDSVTVSGTALSVSTSSTGSSLSRKRDQPDDEDNDGDSPRHRPRLLPTSEANLLLACPFYKKNPLLYRSCRGKLLRSISRVKFHLLRCHRIPIHCDRCSMIFQTESDRSEHLRQTAPCEVTEREHWEAINEDQRRQLSRRVSPKSTTHENWYQIYSIIFPGSDPPESPYLDGIESKELRGLLEFAEREGPNIIDELMRNVPNNMRLQQDEINDFLQSTYQDFLSSLFERWESDHRTRNLGDEPIQSHSEAPKSSQTPLAVANTSDSSYSAFNSHTVLFQPLFPPESSSWNDETNPSASATHQRGTPAVSNHPTSLPSMVNNDLDTDWPIMSLRSQDLPMDWFNPQLAEELQLDLCNSRGSA